MKKVCFLNGHLILREHKTGVHIFHEKVTKKILEKKRKYDVNIAYFDCKNKYSKYLEKNQWMGPFVNVCEKAPRILSYILPIELFFGYNDVYFCDGLFPHTMKKSKKICLVHDLMVKIYPENYTLMKKLYLNLFFNKLKKADAIICVSNNTKEDIIKYYNVEQEKITVCYNGIDNVVKNIDEPESKLIKKGDEFFLYIGDMRKNKNLLNTVKGFLEFCKRNKQSETKLYIAGKQNDEYEIIKEVIDESEYSDRIVFLGYVSEDDKNYLYSHAKCVLLISFYEGFGMPIIEAMQRYKPVITSNCSSMKEIGENAAILVDPNDIGEIADKMAYVDMGDYKIDRNEYDKRIRKFSFDNVSEIINEVINNVL